MSCYCFLVLFLQFGSVLFCFDKCYHVNKHHNCIIIVLPQTYLPRVVTLPLIILLSQEAAFMAHSSVTVWPSSQAWQEAGCEPYHQVENVTVGMYVRRGRAERCHQGNLPVLVCPRLVLYTMQSENKPCILHTRTSTHQPPPSTAGVCVNREKVLMFAEVKVICQTVETAGWLCRGNWYHC